jgi:hypothetical protein
MNITDIAIGNGRFTRPSQQTEGSARNTSAKCCGDKRGRFVRPLCHDRTRRSFSPRLPQSVLEVRALKQSIQKCRQEAFPKTLRTWAADRADAGDARAAAQLRGWRYADQRNQRRLDPRLESNALHIGPPPIVTAAPTGPTSHNRDLQNNRRNNRSPIRSQRHESGRSTARPATFRTR